MLVDLSATTNAITLKLQSRSHAGPLRGKGGCCDWRAPRREDMWPPCWANGPADLSAC